MNYNEGSFELRQLFFSAGYYCELVMESLVLDPAVLEPISKEQVDKIISHGYCKAWEGAPRLAMELKRDDYIIHYIFPNLTDEERRLLQSLRTMCHLLKRARFHELDTLAEMKFDEFDQSAENARQCHADWEIAQQAVINSGLERKLTELQMQALESSFFDPNAGPAGGYERD